MSRVVMPRAYDTMIRSLNPSNRLWPFADDLRLEAAVAIPRDCGPIALGLAWNIRRFLTGCLVRSRSS